MRKILIGVMLGMFLAFAGMAFSEEIPIKILLDGREIYSDTPPQIINDRTFVPIRVISEALGFMGGGPGSARSGPDIARKPAAL